MKFLKKYFPVIAIILIATFFRLYRISDYTEFLGDQGRDMVIIRDFLKNGDLFFIGPQTSIGNMYLGPYYYYLIAPSLLIFGFNPVGPAIFIAILGILTTWLIYYVSKKWFQNNTIALIASFLYAVSPVAIKYSSFSWNPNIMPLFSLIFVYFFTLAIFKNKYIYLSLAVIAFIFCINSHYLALMLLPIGGLLWLWHAYMLYRSKSLHIKNFYIHTAIAIAIFLISLTPQILFDIKHQGQNFKAMAEFFTHRETTVSIKPYKAIPEMWPLFNQIETRLIAGKNITYGVYVSILSLLAILFLLFTDRKLAKQKYPYLLISLAWLAIGLVGLGLYKQHIYDHYFGFLFPAVFIVTGYIIGRLLEFKSIVTKIFSLLFLSGLTILAFIENPLRFSPNRQIPTTQAITSSIISESEGKPFNLALIAKQNYDPPYRYYFYESGSPLYDLNQQLTDQLFVICEPWQTKCEPINNSLWEIAAFGWSKVDKQWQIGDIQVFKLVHTQK